MGHVLIPGISGISGISGRVDALTQALPQDGRQSEAALAIARGTGRCLAAHGLAPLPEFTLPDGRRADLITIGRNGEIWIIEIKSSLADFRADQKWADYRAYCDQLYFAVAEVFPIDILPDDTGLIIANAYGAEIIRDAPIYPMAAARRKVLTTGIAIAATQRLHRLFDPGLAIDGV
jgi:hypothetical protein